MCLGFGSFYTQSNLNQIQKKTDTTTDTFIGHFATNQGKTTFQVEYSLKHKIWNPFLVQCALINIPEKFSTDSSYIITGKLYPIQPDVFNTKQMVYSNYSKNKFYRIYISNSSSLNQQNSNLIDLEQSLSQKIHSNFSEKSSSYLNAILLGNKSGLNNYKAIQNIGIAHLFAASGYHVGILYGIIFLIFSIIPKFKYKTITEFIIALSVIWFYASILQYGASILRASFLFTFIGILRVLKRKFNMIELLSLIGIIMVIYNPLIVYSISFQLSFLAVYSILLFFPLIQKLYLFTPKFIKIPMDLLNISISAQLLTLPLSIYYFNTFPTYSLLSNITVAPLVSITIPISVLSLFLDTINVPNQYISTLVDLFFNFIDLLISTIQALPYRTIDHLFINTIEVLLMIILFLLCFSIISKPKNKPIFKIGILSILLFTFKIERNYSITKFSQQEAIYIVPQRGRCNFYYLKNNNLYAFETTPNAYINSKIKQKHHLNNTTKVLLENENFNFYINKLHFRSNQKIVSTWLDDKLKFRMTKMLKKTKHINLNEKVL